MLYSTIVCSPQVKDRYQKASRHLRVVQDCIEAFWRGDDERKLAYRYSRLAQRQIDSIELVMDRKNPADQAALDQLLDRMSAANAHVDNAKVIINTMRETQNNISEPQLEAVK